MAMDGGTFQAYAAIVEREYGIQLPNEKQALLESRLVKMLNEHQGEGPFHDASSFLRWLQEDRTGRAVRLLGEAITTHHTYFMREKEHFDIFKERTLPWLEETAAPDRDLRVWCAASSTGEEPYTLAMLMADYFALKGTWEKTLLATDVSQEVLDKAACGRYPHEAVAGLPQHWQRLYFQRMASGDWQAVDSLRRSVLFRPFNLMTAVFPFRKPFHVIFCRNVMIYFDQQRRSDLVRKFYEGLCPGGWLFIGHAETITRDMAPFEFCEPSVYRKPMEARPVLESRDEKGLLVRPPAPQPAPQPVPEKPDSPLQLIAIGASTGGTEALSQLLKGLAPPLPPIVIVQHIPPHFSQLFAARLDEEGRLSVKEAEDGDRLERNHVYIAPGDKHLRIRKIGGMLLLSCVAGPLVSGHCPSVDVMFRSAAILKEKALGVILTGMGNDGAEGLLAMREAGAVTLGQDEATSVVYGMPREAFLKGAVSRQIPLPAMAGAITAHALGMKK